MFGLSLAIAAWLGGGKKPNEAKEVAAAAASGDVAAQLSALSKAVQAQAARIAHLEGALAKGPPTRQCAAEVTPAGFDLQPELQPFKLAEAQRALKRQQEQVVSVFNVSIGTPIVAVALSTQLVEKSVPRLAAAAGLSGALHLFDKAGDLVAKVQTAHAAHATITAVIFGTKEDPFVATAATDGQVLIYDLSLPKAARPRKKRPVRRNASDEEKEEAAAAEAVAEAEAAAAAKNYSLSLAAQAAPRLRSLRSGPARTPPRRGRPRAWARRRSACVARRWRRWQRRTRRPMRSRWRCSRWSSGCEGGARCCLRATPRGASDSCTATAPRRRRCTAAREAL